MTRSLLADAFEHHVWATLRVIDACATLPANQLDTTVPGTYGSIIGTMRHLVCSFSPMELQNRSTRTRWTSPSYGR